jgi:inorganic triphosphatase YgiF
MSQAFPKELEIKLALAGSSDLKRLAESLGPPESDTEQENTFYDTEEGDLAAGGWALRLRRERPPDSAGEAGSERFYLTLKGPATRIGSAVQRNELERELNRIEARKLLDGTITFTGLELGPPLPALKGVHLNRMRRTARFINRRYSHRLTLGGKRYELELDETTFEDGTVDHELEMELPEETDPAELVLVQKELESHLDRLGIRFKPQPKGKYSRALEHGDQEKKDEAIDP